MRQLRPYQIDAINDARTAFRAGSRRPLVQAPTGAGKTTIMAALAENALAKGGQVIVTVPRIELIDQTVASFGEQGITRVGVIQADHMLTDFTQPVQIASLATLKGREIPEATLVLVDEAHERSQFLVKWMAKPEWAKVPFIGFSATPWSRGLAKQYDRLIVATTTAQLIAEGYLSPFKAYAPSKPDLSGVRTVNTTHGRDYDESELAEAMLKGTLVADIVSTWLAKADGRPTLCFAVNRIHAKTIAAQFSAAGVPCGYIDGYSTPDERRQVRRQFQAGELKVVCNVGVLTTGVDWDVRCIILARPTKSEILYTQIVGRGLRTAPGKDHCLILDHSDTTLRLGFVTDIHHDRLDDGTAKVSRLRSDAEAQPKECPQCHYVRAPKVFSCPACGYVPEAVSKVESIEGELVDLSSARRANRGDGWPEKVVFIRQLRAYALESGKRDTWVATLYKVKYGVWPNDARVKYAAPAAGVSPEVRGWIKSRAIAYAKRRQA